MKWNTTNNSSLESQSLHSSELTLSFSTTFSPSNSLPTNPTLHHLPNQPGSLSLEKEKSWRGPHFWQSETNGVYGQCTMSLHNSNPNSNTNSSTSDETSNNRMYRPKFKELNAENLKILCNALERKVPRQKVIVPEMASAILQCRSGMKRRKECRVLSGIREDTWFLFQGRDNEGKENIARETASLIFGSQNHFVSLRLGTLSPTTRCTSPDHNITNKRSRLDTDHGYLEQVFHALYENPHRVIFIKDVDQLDYNGKLCIRRAIQDGAIRNVNGEEISFDDSIIVLSCDVFKSWSPQTKRKVDHEGKELASEKEADSGFCLDLNLCVNDNVEECFFDDVGLLEAVDQVFCFKLQEDL